MLRQNHILRNAPQAVKLGNGAFSRGRSALLYCRLCSKLLRAEDHVIFSLIQYVDKCHNPILFQYMCEHAPGKNEYTSGYAINWARCLSTSRTDYRKCQQKTLSTGHCFQSISIIPARWNTTPCQLFKHWNHFFWGGLFWWVWSLGGKGHCLNTLAAATCSN